MSSILELFEYRFTLKDVNYAMANGVITYDNPAMPLDTEEVSHIIMIKAVLRF